MSITFFCKKTSGGIAIIVVFEKKLHTFTYIITHIYMIIKLSSIRFIYTNSISYFNDRRKLNFNRNNIVSTHVWFRLLIIFVIGRFLRNNIVSISLSFMRISRGMLTSILLHSCFKPFLLVTRTAFIISSFLPQVLVVLYCTRIIVFFRFHMNFHFLLTFSIILSFV